MNEARLQNFPALASLRRYKSALSRDKHPRRYLHDLYICWLIVAFDWEDGDIVATRMLNPVGWLCLNYF
jgi:hypothetical protein